MNINKQLIETGEWEENTEGSVWLHSSSGSSCSQSCSCWFWTRIQILSHVIRIKAARKTRLLTAEVWNNKNPLFHFTAADSLGFRMQTRTSFFTFSFQIHHIKDLKCPFCLKQHGHIIITQYQIQTEKCTTIETKIPCNAHHVNNLRQPTRGSQKANLLSTPHMLSKSL